MKEDIHFCDILLDPQYPEGNQVFSRFSDFNLKIMLSVVWL